MEDLSNKVTGGTLSAAEWNQVPSELQSVIVKSGGEVLTNGSFDQLGRSIALLGQASDFFTETSGSDTDYVCSAIGTRHTFAAPVGAEHDGMLIRFRPGTTNIIAANTLNVASSGVKPLVREDLSALGAGDITPNRDALIRYDFGNDSYLLLEAGLSSEALPVPPRGYIDGFITTNDVTFPLARVNFASGICRDGTDAVTFRHAVSMTKRIDANWAEGTDNGGFPASLTLSADTWYHMFAIHKTSDGTIDFGFDTSPTAANLLSGGSTPVVAGYNEFRRIGAVKTRQGAAEINQYTQHGDVFSWKALSNEYQDASDTSPGTAQVTYTLNSVPDGIAVLADVNICFFSSSTQTEYAVWGGGDVTLADPGSGYNDGRAHGDDRSIFASAYILTNTSAQINTRQDNGGSGQTNYIQIHGWKDPRGKDA